MTGDEKLRYPERLPHQLLIEGRSKISVSGVTDVESFDETLIAMETSEGTLRVKGSGLNVTKLSLENGELSLEGHVDALEYDDITGARGGLLSRLFG